MLNKEIKFGLDSKKAILKGINLLGDAVKITLGPKGQCVVIGEYSNGQPHITKDGVTVAKNIQDCDKFTDTGINLIREASVKTLDVVGDATTTSTVLAQCMINESMDALNSGHNPVLIKKGINEMSNKVIESIRKNTISIKDGDIKRIATISANNDSDIGNLVANTFEKITKDGVVVVEEANNINTSVNIVNGMEFDRGYISPHFVTDFISYECVLKDPLILVNEQKIQSINEIRDLIEHVHAENRSLLLIAEDFDSSVIETLKLNKLNNILSVCAVKAPSFGEYRTEFLEDIATITGAKNITYECGLNVSNVKIGMLGSCKEVIVTKDSTTIIGGMGTKENVDNRILQLRNQLKDVMSKPEQDQSFMIDFIQKRIAKLIGGIATIMVGGVTELEMKEKKDRVDDAIAATRAAIEEGVICGGGLAYLCAQTENSDFCSNNYDVNFGIEIVKHGLESIFNQIIINSGKDPKDIINGIDLNKGIGWDAENDKYVDMYDAGIIDPSKAVRLAFENAISVVNLFLSTGCVIVPEKVSQIVTF